MFSNDSWRKHHNPRYLHSHCSLNPLIKVGSFIHHYLTIQKSNWRDSHLLPFRRDVFKYVCDDEKKDNLAVKPSCLFCCGVFRLKWNAMNSVTCEGGGGGGRIRKGTKKWRGRWETPPPSSSSRPLWLHFCPPPPQTAASRGHKLSSFLPPACHGVPHVHRGTQPTACPTLKMHRPVPTEKLWGQRLRFGRRISAMDTKTLSEVKRSSSLKTP